jgi:hypothetical protein
VRSPRSAGPSGAGASGDRRPAVLQTNDRQPHYPRGRRDARLEGSLPRPVARMLVGGLAPGQAQAGKRPVRTVLCDDVREFRLLLRLELERYELAGASG